MLRKFSWTKSEKRLVFGSTLLCGLVLAIPLGRPVAEAILKVPDCIEMPTGAVCRGIAWSPDNKLLATHLEDANGRRRPIFGDLSIWDVETKKMVKRIPLPINTMAPTKAGLPTFRWAYQGREIMWMDDNSLIAAGENSPVIKITLSTSKAQRLLSNPTLHHLSPVHLSFSNDLEQGIAVDHHLTILHRYKGGWDVRFFLDWLPKKDSCGEMLPDGKSFLLVAYSKKDFESANPVGAGTYHLPYKLLRLDTQNGQKIWKRDNDGARMFTLSPDGKTAYVTFITQKPRLGWEDVVASTWIEAIATNSGHTLWKTPQWETHGFASPIISPDGRFLAVREKYKATTPRVLIFNTTSGKNIVVLTGRKLEFSQQVSTSNVVYPQGRQLGFSPDGKKLALAFSNRLYIWQDRAWTSPN